MTTSSSSSSSRSKRVVFTCGRRRLRRRRLVGGARAFVVAALFASQVVVADTYNRTTTTTTLLKRANDDDVVEMSTGIIVHDAFEEEDKKEEEDKERERTRRKRTSIASAGGEAEETHPAESLGASFRHFSLKHRKMDVNDMDALAFEREDAALRRRRALRQSSSAGVELNGKARDTGYFYATLTIGTPGRQYEVIVDTGSTYTFVTCYPCTCVRPTRDQRAVRRGEIELVRTRVVWVWVYYWQLSSVGIVRVRREVFRGFSDQRTRVSDVIDVGGSLGAPRIHFGCNTLETNMLKTQRANGMIALGRHDASLHRQLKKKAYPPGSYDGTFGLCLGSFEGGGVLSLGKLPEQHYANFVTRKTHTSTVKLVKGSKSQYYNVEVVRMFVRDTELRRPSGRS